MRATRDNVDLRIAAIAPIDSAWHTENAVSWQSVRMCLEHRFPTVDSAHIVIYGAILNEDELIILAMLT